MSVVISTHTREALYTELRHFFYRRTGSHMDADDLTQETWLAVLGFRAESSLRHFVFSVARRRLADWHRRRGKWGEFEQETDALLRPDPSTSFDSKLSQMRAAQILSWAVDTLDEPFRTTIQLSIDGLTGPEISEKLGVPCGTIRSRLARGRAALRAVLESAGWTRK